METAGACFERCLGQAPAEVLILGQLEASASCIVAQSQSRAFYVALACYLSLARHGFKPQFKARCSGPTLVAHCSI